MLNKNNITDPRVYSTVYPDTNMVLNLAKQVVENKLDFVELVQCIGKQLADENDALINVALNLAPSCEISQMIWQGLNVAIHQPSEIDSYANIFAIPLVLVAGSNNKTQVPGVINVDKLNQLFIENGVFIDAQNGFVAGKLIDPTTMASINPSQMFYWVRNLQQAKLWLPLVVSGSPIDVLNEGVFLRFLCGVTIDSARQSNFSNGAYGTNSIKLMQLIGEELKTDGITLFPIPFSPVCLNEAFSVGDSYRKEVAFQVSLSNIIRKLREQSLTPIATISHHEEALKLFITSTEPSVHQETSVWHLQRFDDFTKIHTTITDILIDMQVEYQYD